MQLIFGQPLGLWALLGIPIVLLIHLLQHEAKRHRISTLFLVEHISMDGREGRVLDRIRSSLQLWLQLLAVLLLTWVLLQPRWISRDSFQRVIVVLDDSASMSAFRDEVAQVLRDELPPFQERAAFTEWTLLPSSRESSTLYSGSALPELLAGLGAWRPTRGEHDLQPVLRVAQGLAGRGGVVLLVSDRLHDNVSMGVQQVAVGESVANCGFSGIRVTRDDAGPTWNAVVRNYGNEVAERTWWVEVGGRQAEARTITIPPGESHMLSGPFPDADSFVLKLHGDRFAMDDALPVVRPRAKTLGIDVAVHGELKPIVRRVVDTLDDVETSVRGLVPDVELLSFRAPGVPGPRTDAICLCSEVADGGVDATGMVLVEDHPLVRGLAWQGLVAGRLANLTSRDGDDVLVWQGEHPLVLLRTTGATRQLIFAFDVVNSNAAQQPAFVLVMHRFVESVRQAKRGRVATNVELGQLVPIPLEGETGELLVLDPDQPDAEPMQRLPARHASLFRAPDQPQRFHVMQGRDVLLDGAAHFADVREADFRACTSGSDMTEVLRSVEVRNSKPDPLLPLWMVLLGCVMMWSWNEGGRRR